MIKFRRILVMTVVVISLLIVTASAEWSYTDSSNLLNIKTDVSLIRGYVDYVESLLTTANNKLDNINLNLSNISTSLGSISTGLTNVNNSITASNNHLFNIASSADQIRLLVDSVDERLESSNDFFSSMDANLSSVAFFSEMTMVNTADSQILLDEINTSLFDLHEVFASEEDLALKDTSKDSVVESIDVLSESNVSGQVSSAGTILRETTEFFDMPDTDVGELFVSVEYGPSTWFSPVTASQLLVGAGSSALSGVSAASVYVPPETPYFDFNISSAKDRLGWE